jgi:MFS family permease
LLRHPGFVLFWVSRIFSSLGFQVASVAVGWLVYAKTGSAYALGLVGLFQFLPMIVLTFLVGHIADRFDRRRIVATCQFVEFVVLAFLTFGDRDGKLDVTVLFAAVALLGAARAFEAPTMSALLPALVPGALLQKAVAVSSSAMQTATIVGPSVGGLLYAGGASLPLGVAALCLSAACSAMLVIRMERKPPKREPISFQSVFSGVSFIRSRPIILGAISLDLFAVLLGGVTALLPIFARDILHTGPWGLGFLRSAPCVGSAHDVRFTAPFAHDPAGRGEDVCRSDRLWDGNFHFFSFRQFRDLTSRSHNHGRSRQCQRGHPDFSGPTFDPGCDARSGQRGQFAICWNFKPAWRI